MMIGAGYRTVHDRVVAALAEADVSSPVPACPGWSVFDVVAHLTGLAADVVGGATEGYAGDEWTQAQVEARRGSDLASVLAEWDRLVGPLCAILDDPEASALPEVVMTGAGPAPRRAFPAAVLGDALHHQFDVYGALGIVQDRNTVEVMQSAEGHVKALRPLFTAKGLPTLRVENAETGRLVDVGHEEPTATLRASGFEIMRSIGGRRTTAEIRSMEWSGDPSPFLDHMVLPYMRAPEQSLGERV